MSLSYLLSLGDGVIFHRFRKNPFRPTRPSRPSLLLAVKPASTRPIQPALNARHAEPTSHLSPGIRSASGTFARQSAEACSPQLLSRTDKVEVLVLKLLALALALACVGCGFGIQHIAYVRQKNALCRQLRQKEVELRTVTQACRSLEYSVAARAADDFRRVEACIVIAKNAVRKVPTRG